jgi:hypothetical protein
MSPASKSRRSRSMLVNNDSRSPSRSGEMPLRTMSLRVGPIGLNDAWATPKNPGPGSL